MQIKKDLKRVSDDLQLNQTNRLRRHSHNAFSNTPSTRYPLSYVLILAFDIYNMSYEIHKLTIFSFIEIYQHPEHIQPGRNPPLLLDFGVEVQLVSKITVF